MTLSLLILAFAAFWPTYLSKPWLAIDGYTHTHALLGILWLVVLIVQPLLIFGGYRSAHRATGRASLFVAFAFVISGLLLTHFRVSRMSEEAFVKEGIYIYLPLAVAMLFGVACGLGLVWRQSPQVHARFMVSTALLLIDPVLARVMFSYLPPLPSENMYQGITFSLIAVAMAALVWSLPAFVKGRTWYRNYCLCAMGTLVLFFAIPLTSPWLAFVLWFQSPTDMRPVQAYQAGLNPFGQHGRPAGGASPPPRRAVYLASSGHSKSQSFARPATTTGRSFRKSMLIDVSVFNSEILQLSTELN